MPSSAKYSPDPNGEIISYTTSLKYVAKQQLTCWMDNRLWLQALRGLLALALIVFNLMRAAFFFITSPVLAVLFRKNQKLRIDEAEQERQLAVESQLRQGPRARTRRKKKSGSLR